MSLPRALDMRQLRHVRALDRFRNYRRAAESLCISQPALTKSIQQLEATLGVALFERDSGGLIPTPACHVILDHARRLLLEFDEMYHRLDALAQLRGGEFKVGSGPIMAECLLAEPLGALLDELPEVRIEVIIDDWSNLTRLARQGDLHVLVTDLSWLCDERDLDVTPLGRMENILVCSALHPLAAGRRLEPTDLIDYPLALPPMTKRLSNWLTQHARASMLPHALYAATHRIQCQSVPLLRRLVHRTNHITGGPRQLFEQEIATGELVQLELDGCDVLYSEPSVAYLRERALAPPALRFIELLAGQASARSELPGLNARVAI